MATERITNYTEARQNLKSLMDSVTEDRVPVVITRTTGDPVVMLSKAEYDATMETFHLLRSPRNAERLRAAIADVEAGDVEAGNVVHADLVDGEITERR